MAYKAYLEFADEIDEERERKLVNAIKQAIMKIGLQTPSIIRDNDFYIQEIIVWNKYSIIWDDERKFYGLNAPAGTEVNIYGEFRELRELIATLMGFIVRDYFMELGEDWL